MDIDATVATIRRELRALSTPERAENEKKYQKSDLEFIGVTVPNIRAVTRALLRGHKGMTRDELWHLFEALWATGVWELRTVCVLLLESSPANVLPIDLPRLRNLVIESSCWAFNDSFGCHVVGGVVARNPGALSVMDEWAQDDNLWVRRVAMQSLLLPMRAGDLTAWPRFVRYAEPRLDAKDFWTRKVIGWILREVSKKSPEVVAEFLERNKARVSGLTRREGSKYL